MEMFTAPGVRTGLPAGVDGLKKCSRETLPATKYMLQVGGWLDMASRKCKQYERKTFRENNTLSLVHRVETTMPQCLDK